MRAPGHWLYHRSRRLAPRVDTAREEGKTRVVSPLGPLRSVCAPWSGVGVTSLRRAFLVLGPFLVVGCVGEASVRYLGTVSIAPSASGYSFDVSPNPEGLKPIPSASVALCVCTQPCECDQNPRVVATTDERGRFRTEEVVFPGFIGTKTYIALRVTAPGYDPLVFSMLYGQPSTDNSSLPESGRSQFNVRLQASPSPPEPAPAASALPDPLSSPEASAAASASAPPPTSASAPPPTSASAPSAAPPVASSKRPPGKGK